MEKLVSVIIASYNHEKYIEATIKSVLNQTYQNIELIVQDDCSTDNSVDILKKIKDKRLKKVYSKKNKGTVRTFNDLLSMCHGDYIAILGSDDLWYPDKLAKQVKCLEENHVEAVFSMADIIDEYGNLYEDDANFSTDIFKDGNMSQGKRMRLFYECGNHLCHPSSLISKKVFTDIGFYDCRYRQLHDFEYWVRMINKYNVIVMDEKLLGYRRFSTGNLSGVTLNNTIRHINEHHEIIKEMFEIIEDDIFIDGFKDLFVNKKSCTKDQLFCEKFLLLLNFNLFGVNNRQLALTMLFSCDNSQKIIDMLEKQYHYTLNDLYKDTSEIQNLYPYDIEVNAKPWARDLVKRNSELEKELNAVYLSKSWVLTKPLRKFMEVIKNGKHRN